MTRPDEHPAPAPDDALDEIRARLDAANPEQWGWVARGRSVAWHVTIEDGDLISHAPDDLRYLLAEVERLTRERDEWRGIVVEAALETYKPEGAEIVAQKVHEYACRAESAEAEVATLRATVERIETLPDEWGHAEDAELEHVVTCHDYGCKTCVVIACATDLRAALRNKP